MENNKQPAPACGDVVERIAEAIASSHHQVLGLKLWELTPETQNKFINQAKAALAAMPQQQLNANALRDFLTAWFFNKDFAKEGIECNSLAHAIVERFSAAQQPALSEDEAVATVEGVVLNELLKFKSGSVLGDVERAESIARALVAAGAIKGATA